MKKAVFKILYKYMVLFIIAAVMCVGAVSARYATTISYSAGELSVGAFGYSYSIDNVSSTTFNNLSWNTTLGANTPRSITFTINNTDTVSGLTSDVDAQSIFRFSGPYALLSKMAFQLVYYSSDNLQTAVTPQYSMATIISNVESGDTTYDSSQTDYDSEPYSGTAQTLSVSGTSGSSYTAVYSDSDGDTTITLRHAATYENTFMLSYSRGEPTYSADGTQNLGYSDTSQSAVYLECSCSEDLFEYWYLDISIPSLYLQNYADYGEQSGTFLFYFVPITQQDFSADYDDMNYNSTDGTCTIDITDNGTPYTADVLSTYFNVDDVYLYTDYDKCVASSTATTTDNYAEGTDYVTGTVKVYHTYVYGTATAETYTYYYYDSSTATYTEFTSYSGSSTIFTVTVDLNGVDTTYYINTAQQYTYDNATYTVNLSDPEKPYMTYDSTRTITTGETINITTTTTVTQRVTTTSTKTSSVSTTLYQYNNWSGGYSSSGNASISVTQTETTIEETVTTVIVNTSVSPNETISTTTSTTTSTSYEYDYSYTYNDQGQSRTTSFDDDDLSGATYYQVRSGNNARYINVSSFTTSVGNIDWDNISGTSGTSTTYPNEVSTADSTMTIYTTTTEPYTVVYMIDEETYLSVDYTIYAQVYFIQASEKFI